MRRRCVGLLERWQNFQEREHRLVLDEHPIAIVEACIEREIMTPRFSNKSVLIAGGTGGLGRAVSLAFLDEGAKLNVTYRDQKECDALKNAAGANASSLQGHKVDVTDEAAVKQLIEKIPTEQKRLDV